jgi:hypothetical protein
LAIWTLGLWNNPAVESRIKTPGQSPPSPNTRARILCAICLGILAAVGTYTSHRHGVDSPSDWDEIWAAGRALLSGYDPYAAIQKAHVSGQFRYPLVYPGTAVLASLPFASLPLSLGLAIWSGLGTGMLGWALTGRGWWGLLAFCSVPFYSAYELVQWSPLLTGAVAFPWLGLLWVAKPTIGIPLFVAWPSRQAAIGGAVLIVMSLIVMPRWPWSIAEGLRTTTNVMAPISRPGGFLLLLALLRWRLPEGRLLGTLALVPQTTFYYEMVPLLLIPRTPRQMIALVLLTRLAYHLQPFISPLPPRIGFTAVLTRLWPFCLVLIYIPALLMVLYRPNQGGTGVKKLLIDRFRRTGLI